MFYNPFIELDRLLLNQLSSSFLFANFYINILLYNIFTNKKKNYIMWEKGRNKKWQIQN